MIRFRWSFLTKINIIFGQWSIFVKKEFYFIKFASVKVNFILSSFKETVKNTKNFKILQKKSVKIFTVNIHSKLQ